MRLRLTVWHKVLGLHAQHSKASLLHLLEQDKMQHAHRLILPCSSR